MGIFSDKPPIEVEPTTVDTSHRDAVKALADRGRQIVADQHARGQAALDNDRK
jgi:hypothetical protein